MAVAAVLVDPGARSVRAVALPTLPGVPGRHGPQLDPERLADLIGRRIEVVDMVVDGEVLLVAGDGPLWRLGLDGPWRGPGLLVKYDATRDTYADTALNVEQVADLVEIEEEVPGDPDPAAMEV